MDIQNKLTFKTSAYGDGNLAASKFVPSSVFRIFPSTELLKVTVTLSPVCN
ncbi:hypothetical protein ACSVDA_19570 [Cytobacillus sp. Hm23]